MSGDWVVVRGPFVLYRVWCFFGPLEQVHLAWSFVLRSLQPTYAKGQGDKVVRCLIEHVLLCVHIFFKMTKQREA